MIGNGVRVLLQKAANGDPQIVEDGLEMFLAYYHEHMYDHTAPFPDIPNTLDALTTLGHRFAVLSNKQHQATVKMVDRLLGKWEFQPVFGQREDVPLKPDPLRTCGLSGWQI